MIFITDSGFIPDPDPGIRGLKALDAVSRIFHIVPAIKLNQLTQTHGPDTCNLGSILKRSVGGP
jgi:hypothetical protein